MSLSTHVLDTTRGRPAAGLKIRLEVLQAGAWGELVHAETDADGRHRFTETLPAGTYQLVFDTGSYLRGLDEQGFYPFVPVVFEIREPSQHHHVPLLLSPYGYSTYRGS